MILPVTIEDRTVNLEFNVVGNMGFYTDQGFFAVRTLTLQDRVELRDALTYLSNYLTYNLELITYTT